MDTSKDNNKTNKPDPDPEPFNDNNQSIEKYTYDWERGKKETFANNASIHNATLDIEKKCNAQKDNDEVDNISRQKDQNIPVESSMSPTKSRHCRHYD